MFVKTAIAVAALSATAALGISQAQARPDIVAFRGDYSPGTIVVKTNERRLYLVVDPGHAVRYPVGVGKPGKQWAGTTRSVTLELECPWSLSARDKLPPSKCCVPWRVH